MNQDRVAFFRPSTLIYMTDSKQQKQTLLSKFFAPKPKAAFNAPPTSTEPENASKHKLEDQKENEPRKKVATDQVKNGASTAKPATGLTTSEPAIKEQPTKPRNPKNQSAMLAAQRKFRYNYRGPDSLLPAHKQDLTDEERRAKDEMHEKFFAKLGKPGSIEAIKRGRYEAGSLAQNDEEEDKDEQPEEDDEASPLAGLKKKLSHKSAAKSAKKKLTPMEQQFVDLKRANPDVLLVVEVGYKFRLFGEDARIASKELSMFLVPGRMSVEDNDPRDQMYTKFASMSFPIQRLRVHVKRLVDSGHKVGVVRQMETAALKAAGDNRNAPFERKLTHLYTKGTYIDEFEGLGSSGQFSDKNGASYLLAITEETSSQSKKIGIVAVETSTGDVIHDTFDDTIMLTELETRLLHISPCEILLVGEVSNSTRKLLLQLSSSQLMNTKPRIESIEQQSVSDAAAMLGDFYMDKVSTDATSQKLDFIFTLSDAIKQCLAALITYLKSFKLEHVFDLTKNFSPFSSKAHMFLNGNTITSLEIFNNQTDFKAKGSLFWVMDHTRTPFGQRLLKKWIGNPLLSREAIEYRVAAVTELRTGYNKPIEKILNVMRNLPDLEKGLIRIYFERCSRKDIYHVLNSLNLVGTCLLGEKIDFKSDILNRLFGEFSKCAEDTTGFLSRINKEAALKNEKWEFFQNDLYESIEDAKMVSLTNYTNTILTI